MLRLHVVERREGTIACELHVVEMPATTLASTRAHVAWKDLPPSIRTMLDKVYDPSKLRTDVYVLLAS